MHNHSDKIYKDDLMFYEVIGYDKNGRGVISGIWRYNTPHDQIMKEIKEYDASVVYAEITVYPIEG